ncbi:RTA1 like protein-domain-containing protein [Aspergillus carlsbadensis]|nr:RTA1 like protein-domain-containing protein [Aspergillus carlsbadensis]
MTDLDTSNCTAVTPECPVSATVYGYTPSLPANAALAAFFGLCGVYHVIIGVKARSWTFMIALAAGSLMEMIGYTARIGMHNNVWDDAAFSRQITCLILAPSFVAAGIYWSLKRIVMHIGPEHSRLRPNLYPWVFIGCDVVSIIMQAAGGGIAGSAGDDHPDRVNLGNNVMIAGIAFQVGTMTLCGILAIDFVWRVSRGTAAGEKWAGEGRQVGFYAFCAAEVWAFVTVLIRSIYRLPEMAGGWGNPLMQNELEFLVLDGMMVALAVLGLSILHPFWTCRSLLKKRT